MLFTATATRSASAVRGPACRLHSERRRHSGSRPAVPALRRSRVVVRAAEDGKEESAEDVMARLAAAEKEAEQLRKMLEEAQGGGAALADQESSLPANKRIDGTGFRETIWSVQKGSGEKVKSGESWLQEGNSFITGDSPSELENSMEMTDEEKATVNRRLLGGLAATAAFCAFALVPDKEVRPKPSKPLFFYLVPLLRIKNILSEIEPTVSKGDPVALRATVNTIVGSPWNAKENLKQAALCLDSDKDYQVANAIATEFVEYMSQVDYSKYFDSVTTSVNERQLIFSLQSARAAERKLDEFFRLMPSEQLDAAKQQVAAF